MAESGTDLSVVICTRNRRESLLRALASLASQHSGARWEVLVVDNGSDDDTRAAVETLAPEFGTPLRVVTEPAHGLSYARNAALREGRGRAVVYIDDDVTCRPGWVDAHARALAAPDVLATGGRILPVLPDGLPARLRATLEVELGGPTGRYDFGDDAQDIPGPRGILLPFGGNLGLLREEGLALGGFRTDLGWGRDLVPSEETELLRRLRRCATGRILYLPDAVVDHHVGERQTSLGYYRRWHRGYGRALVRMGLPPGASRRGVAIARQILQALQLTLRRGGGLEGLRERERCAGMLLELLFGRRQPRLLEPERAEGGGA